MSHANNKFVKAVNQGGEPTAERFSNILKAFFVRERSYDDAGFTLEERLRERQSLETKELLIELRNLLDSELSKNSEVSIIQKLLIIWIDLGKRFCFPGWWGTTP